MGYDRVLMSGCVEEYSFASHCWGGGGGGGIGIYPASYPVTDACVSTKKYMQGGVQYSRTRSPSGIWGVGHIKLETWERTFILL